MKLKIRSKLLLAFTLVLLLTTGVNIYGLIQMNVLAGLATKIYNHPLQVTRAVLKAKNGIIKMHRSMKDVALANDAADMELAHTAVKKYEEEVYEQFSIVQQWILGEEGAVLISEAIQTFRDWTPIREEVIALMKAGEKVKASAITKGKGANHVELLSEKMEALTNYAANKANGMYQSAQATRARVIMTALIALIVVIFLSGLLSLLLSQGIINSVQTINAFARQLVAGELTVTTNNRTELEKVITHGDEMSEIGQAFSEVVNYFRTVIQDIVQISQGLATGNLQVNPNAEYKGDFIQIKEALQAATIGLNSVVKDIVLVSEELAAGNLHTTPQAEYQGDFIQIKNALEIALSNLRQVIKDTVQVSQGLAEGNLRVTPQADYRGDYTQIKQALESALSDLRQVIDDIVSVSQGLAEGRQEITPTGEYRGDFIKIKTALVSAADKLTEATKKNATQDWLKTGLTQLNDQMRGDQEMITLTKNVIAFLTTYLDAKVGLFYLIKEVSGQNQVLKLMASYAYTRRKNTTNEFQMGEGLVGQAALEKQPIVISQVPDEYIKIQSGTGEAVPHNLIVMPFMYENNLKGVIELGTFDELNNIQLDFLNQAMPIIGIAVNTAQSRDKMQELLRQTQTYTDIEDSAKPISQETDEYYG